MKIALDITPIQGGFTGHKVRGVGFYLTYLKRALEQYAGHNQFVFFSNGQNIPRNVDLIHYPYFEPFFVTLPLVKIHRRVVTVHDLTPLVFPKHFPAGFKGMSRWYIQRFNLVQTERIITDSFFSKKDIVKLVGANDKKVSVAHLAAAEEFKPLSQDKSTYIKKKYNLPEQFVLYVGDVTWNKNVPRLMRAIQKIDAPLLMVGKALVEENFDKTNSWNKDRLEIQKLGNENSKKFIRLGFIPTEDLVAIYNSATVFVFPSLYEGFGLPILEAMQSGCPVITTKESSLPEVAGEAAYYVDGYDVENIAKGIETVFNTKKLQDELSEKAIAQAKKFNWKKTAEETIEAYRQCLIH